MSSFAKKHNTSLERLFPFEIPEHFEHADLADLVEIYGISETFKVNAIYINKKGKFGDQPVLATDNELVNAPHHLLDNCLSVLEDAESIALINNGHVGFKIYGYENKYGQQFSLEWVDL